MPLKLIAPGRRKGNKCYLIRGTLAGRRIEESTGTASRPLAEAIAARREAEILKRYLFGPAATASFAEAVNLYLDQGGSTRFLTPILAHFADTPLAEIDQSAVNLAARTLYPGARPATRVRQLHTPVIAILNAAAVAGLCAPKKIRKPRVERPVRQAVAPDYFEKLLPELPQRLGTLLLFLAMTGARVGEAIALTWGDVDLMRGEAILRKTKTRDEDRLTLPSPLVAALANLPRDLDKDRRRGRVFGYARAHSFYDTLKRGCARAGVPYLGTHQPGRHSFVTWLLQDGHSLKTVAEAGRYAGVKIVGDVYGHLERRSVDAAIRKMGEERGNLAAATKKHKSTQ